MYYDLFTNFLEEELKASIFQMLQQKQKIGLINPDWKRPNAIKKNIKPILIFSEFNYKSSAKIKFDEVLKFTRESKDFGDNFLNNLEIYNFTTKNGLTKMVMHEI